jgi:hypothetical protein
MKVREKYQFLFPFWFMLLFIGLGSWAVAQKGILDSEVHLSRNTGEIDCLLREIARKGHFSFTYTSQIDAHRISSVSQKNQTVFNHLSDIFRYDSIQFLEREGKILLIPLSRNALKPEFDLIKGIVVDARTRRPLPYSNVFLINSNKGIVSNKNGRFEFKISCSNQSDTLAVSYIGYKVAHIPIKSIDSALLIVRMTTERIQIREVVVKPYDPIYILTKAVEGISHNYDLKPAIYTGFFRETTSQDNRNISLSEAVIKIFKEPYTSMRTDQVKIFKARKGSNTSSKAYVEFLVQGGLFNTLKLDIVKNLPTFLDAEYFTLYKYRLERTISHFERPTWVISFDRQEDVRYPCFTGKIFIDVETFAIVGAKFALTDKAMSFASGIYVKKTPRKVGVRPVDAHYQVFYRPLHGNWDLSNVRSEVQIRVKRKRSKQQDKFNSLFSSVSEFVITGKDTLNVSRFRMEETSRPQDILEEQIGETDAEFWGEENVILPDEPIETTVNKIGRRNKLFSLQELNAIKIEEEKEAKKEENEEDMEPARNDEPKEL